MEKSIGVLGGMGPEATLICFKRIIKNTPAGKDQDHIRVIIDSNPKVPDRTESMLENGPSPVPLMVSGCRALERAGADFIVIPCVTAHFFIDELRAETDLPILSILDAFSEAVERTNPEIATVGLMGTDGTIKSGMFQKRLAQAGIKTIICDDMHQARVMAAIYDIKKGERAISEITPDLEAAAESLVERGAQGIIAGCTEIPLGLSQRHVSVPFFDSLLILARAAIRGCGIEPLPAS